MKIYLAFNDNETNHLTNLLPDQWFEFEQDGFNFRFFREKIVEKIPDGPVDNVTDVLVGLMRREYSDGGRMMFHLVPADIKANTAILIEIVNKEGGRY